VGVFRRNRETLNEQLLREAGPADERRKQTRLEAPDPALFSLLAGVTGRRTRLWQRVRKDVWAVAAMRVDLARFDFAGERIEGDVWEVSASAL
jgi:hypothetical protein